LLQDLIQLGRHQGKIFQEAGRALGANP